MATTQLQGSSLHDVGWWRAVADIGIVWNCFSCDKVECFCSSSEEAFFFWTCQRAWNPAGSFRRTSRSQFDHLGNSEDQGADKASIKEIWRFPTCPRAFQHHPKFALSNYLFGLGLLWFATVDDEVSQFKKILAQHFFDHWALSPLEVWDSWPRIPVRAKRPQRGSNAPARPRWKSNIRQHAAFVAWERKGVREIYGSLLFFFVWRSPTRIFRCLVSGLTSQFSLLWLENECVRV